MTAIEVLVAKRSEVIEAAARHGAFNVRLFGSAAIDEMTAASDLDILVDMAPGRSLLDQVALQLELEEILGRRVDVVVVGGISPYLEQRIIKEAVPV